MKIAFSTISCPDWTWHELVENGTRFGYDGVEIRLLARETDLLQVPEFQTAELPKRRAELTDAGFQICGLSSSVHFDDAEKSERDKQIAIGRAYVDLAAELGASFVRVFGEVLPDPDDVEATRTTIGNIADGLQSLGDYAESAGLTIVIETHGDYADSRITRRTMELVTSRSVGVLWDTHHPWRFCGERLAETFENLRPWVRHTHWKDSVSLRPQQENQAIREAADQAHTLMGGHRHADYVLFGGGEFPAAGCMQLLREAGYDGWFSLEWEKMWHPELEDPEIALPLFPAKIRALSTNE